MAAETVVTKGNLEPSDTYIAPLQNLIDLRARAASEMIIAGIKDGSVKLAAIYGPMRGGKTTTIYELQNNLPPGQFQLIKLAGLNREGSDDASIWVCNKPMITKNIRAISGLAELTASVAAGDYPPGFILLLEEAQFMGKKKEARKLLAVSQEKQVPLVTDCLGAWFTLKPNKRTGFFVENADIAFLMRGWDHFDHTQVSEATLRVVGVLPDGTVLHEDGEYYRSLGKKEVRRLISAFQDTPFGEKMVMHSPSGFPNVEFCYALPSALTDARFAPGADRYFPVSFENWVRIYKQAGMHAQLKANESGILPISSLYRSANIHQWDA